MDANGTRFHLLLGDGRLDAPRARAGAARGRRASARTA